jgi:hypothetical protein
MKFKGANLQNPEICLQVLPTHPTKALAFLRGVPNLPDTPLLGAFSASPADSIWLDFPLSHTALSKIAAHAFSNQDFDFISKLSAARPESEQAVITQACVQAFEETPRLVKL